MGTIQISGVNWSDSATLSGGSWQPTLPLTNLQQTDLGVAARTVDALAASSRIDIDLGVSTETIRLVGLMKHNISISGTYRITAGTSAGASDVYDSGTLDVWPRVYQYTDLPFEDPRWWTGKIDAAEAALYPIKLLHDCGGNKLARYWRIQITDTTNAAGYIQVTRLWMGPVWEPSVNYSYGARLGWESRDRASVTRAGKRYAERLPPARVFQFQMDALMDTEAYGWVLDLHRRLGTEGQLVVVPDPDDTANRHRRDIMARIRSGDGVTQMFLGYQRAPLVLEELL